MTQAIALIGFGEAGSTFAAAAGWGDSARAYDVDPARRAVMTQSGVLHALDPAEALLEATVCLCLVTADQALAATKSAAAHLSPGALWCDMNSVAPETKRTAARVIAAAGGCYVDVAVLAPVEPARLSVPLLLSGPAADDAATVLKALGFANVRVIGTEVGQASAIKLIRSVMVKGIEALSAEMIAAAEAAGVAHEVLASLDASDKPLPWAAKVANSRERMAAHGLRRAAEMEEAAMLLCALGVDPVMTRATILRQRAAAATPRPDEQAA